MQVAIGSIFRDAEGYAQRYADQVAALREAAPEQTFRTILAEGDSQDNSYEVLKALFDGSVFKRAHGGPKFGSVDSAERFRQFSFVYEAVLERVLPTDEAFIYVESDLVWNPEVVLGLMRHLEKPEVDLVVPFISYQSRFYDTWAFQGLDGVHFGCYPPYHVSMLSRGPNGLCELSSAGSCMVMRAEVARSCHFVPEELCCVGFCYHARSKGYRVWFDSSLTVYHP